MTTGPAVDVDGGPLPGPPSSRSWCPRLTIAVDHGDPAFERLVGPDPTKVGAARAALLHAVTRALDSPGAFDAAVVRPTEVRLLARDRRRLVIGLPDDLPDDGGIDRMVQAAHDCTGVVKLGFDVELDRDDPAASLRRVGEIAAGRRVRVIAEPYADLAAPGVDVRTVMSYVEPLERQRWYLASKIECDWVEALTGGPRLDKPIHVRSAGLDLDTFLERVSQAARYGAQGVIAGTALWGDLLPAAAKAPDRAAAELVRRAHLLRRALGAPGPPARRDEPPVTA